MKLELNVINWVLMLYYKYEIIQKSVSELTSESPVDRLDSVENHTAPSLLSPAGRFQTDPVLSDERGLTSELKP